MRERPILFNGDMVRAILTGAKTQTRRPIKLPHHNPLGQWEACTSGGHGARDLKGNLVPEEVCIWHTRTGDTLVCPVGQPGDRLWVRESWQFEINAMGSAREEDGPFVYAADTYQTGRRIEERWRPSIHMPRWACRLVLEITAVRVERLQAISAQDCLAEGITTRFRVADAADELRIQFRDIWNDTGGDWESNPWVWVIEFNRINEVSNG
ncbi:hypothetical protein [Stenotrophomonas maltophilia]|uniref:Morphogenetic protein n=1 Tax=Stenotrophomonas maltophilia TaxID=40324 RepID=A0A4S2CVL1_STEMA|nr:hypothetical protein [Stenotrophomonas maltophilia]TGY32521.1 hypothetical protein E5352_15150 [Stenotrophomonas maltophilia]